MTERISPFDMKAAIAVQEEIVRRTQIITTRISKMEFTGGSVDADVDGDVTACAMLYAALRMLLEHGVRLSVVVQLVGVVYGLFENITVDRFTEALRETLLSNVLRYLPVDPKARTDN